MEQKIYNLIILDESGSMSMIEKATVKGLNQTIQNIKGAQIELPGQKQFVTLMSFNSAGRTYHYDLTPAAEIEVFDGKKYQPADCTPLYDAIGAGITRLMPFVEKDDKVLVTIITDGMENDSKEYNYKAVSALISKVKEMGWMVTYIGANQDALAVARSMNIDNSLNFEASDDGVEKMMACECRARKRFYRRAAAAPMADEAETDGFFEK